MTRWLSIVGIGEDGIDGLCREARNCVAQADILFGGERHLAMVPDDGRERILWSRPLADSIDRVKHYRGRQVCVLATGDPMHCGIGATLAYHIAADEMTVFPALSAFTLACARMGWAAAQVEMLSLHGRPFDSLNRYVRPGAKLLILSENADTPAAIAARLRALGYGASRISVLERMGGSGERCLDGTADDWQIPPGADLNTVAVECKAGPEVQPLPIVPGLPDDAFTHDGQLTKREVRAVTLAALAPFPGQCLWDVGAGSGAIAIEWMRTDPRCTAFAIERVVERRAMIAENAGRLGVPGLTIVAGQAPAALRDLPAPDAVFIGGGASAEGMFETCWAALKPGGRLVANLVTVEGEQVALAWQRTYGGDLTRIAVSRAEPIGGRLGWKALRPVTQYSVSK